jgi:hypothetical protein
MFARSGATGDQIRLRSVSSDTKEDEGVYVGVDKIGHPVRQQSHLNLGSVSPLRCTIEVGAGRAPLGMMGQNGRANASLTDRTPNGPR